ncbi:MAG: glycosyltransferase family 4 protein [Dehalococcoidia bacterium]
MPKFKRNTVGEMGIDRRRIGYLSLHVPSEGSAAQIHVSEISAGLAERGWSVRCLKPDYAPNNTQPSRFQRVWRQFAVQLKFLSQMRKFDIIYIRAHPAAFLVAAFARVARKPIVHEVNGPLEDMLLAHRFLRPIAAILIFCQRRQLVWASAVIAVTSGLASAVRQQGVSSPVHVVSNGANVELFAPGREPPFPGLPERYVSFVGNFATWQGIDTLLAAASVPSWPSDVSLVIAGSGDLGEEVSRASARDRRVVYLGPIPYRDAGRIVARSIAGLVPNFSLAGRGATGVVPLKLYETMSTAVPVVVTDFPGQADIVRAFDTGLVVPPSDPKALADAVARLCDNPVEAKQMGVRGREYVLEHASWSRQAARTSDVLAQILDG